MESLRNSRILKHCISWKWARWFRHSFIYSLKYLVPSFTEHLWAIYDRWRKLWSVTLGAFQWRSVPLLLELMKETAAEAHLRLDNFTDNTKKGHSKKHKCRFRITTNFTVKQKTPHLRTHSHALASFCCLVEFYCMVEVLLFNFWASKV